MSRPGGGLEVAASRKQDRVKDAPAASATKMTAPDFDSLLQRSLRAEPPRGGKVSSIIRLQEHIAALIEGGASMEQVEREVIDPSPLTTEQKSALWLFGQCLTDGRPADGQPRRSRLSTDARRAGNALTVAG
jgi:hypothetical protein